MFKRLKKWITIGGLLAILVLFIWFLPKPIYAAVVDPSTTNYGLSDSQFSGIGVNKNGDLKKTVTNIINLLLGFLGIIAVVIIAIGGFKWMTAAGNEDQVAEARKMILNGVVGLIIIFLAWAIAAFVISQLKSVAGSESGVSGASAPVQTPLDQTGTPSGGSQAGGLLAGNSGGQTSGLPLAQTGNSSPSPAPTQNIDSDGDGLTNTEEINVYHTDPNKSDTDGDGHPDGTEAQNGYSPTGAGKIVDAQNSQSCSSLLPLLAGALGNAAKLADAQKQIKDCCAQKQDPLCAGF